MSPARYQQVKQIFQAALEVDAARRAAFVAEACAADEGLRAEVASLLAAHEAVSGFIETPAAALVAFDEVTRTGDQTAGALVDGPFVQARVGSYQLLREIGRGGMGVVYLAERADEQYRQRVAIKLLQRGAESGFVVERFRHERQILASLNHPNIARLLDGGATADGLPYFVMEYIEGEPMDHYCDRHRLTTDARLRLFRQVCAAVQYAHQRLVIHRDLKPGNLLVTTEGTPKLLDFGIAKLLATDQASDPTLTAMQMMTPGYASPEQVRGAPVTTATDVYSLGVILFELLTGHRPYQLAGRAPHEIARVVCEQEPTRPSTAVSQTEVGGDGRASSAITPESVSQTRGEAPDKLRRRLAGDLDNIVLMALRKEPARRYASVEQLSEDIRRHLEGLPVAARGDALGYRAGKFIRRHRVGVAAAALIVLALIAGLLATLWQARVAHRERARAERRFNDVRRLANSFLFELNESIERLPGATPAQHLLVRRALEYLDSLAGEAAGDASLQRELATAYEKVGDIQGNPYNANLGDLSGALASYRKALQIREALPASEQALPATRLDLARSYDRIGDIVKLTEGARPALDHYQQALAMRAALATARPDDGEAQHDLARSEENIGTTLGAEGDFAGALAHLHRSMAIVESLQARQPDDAGLRRGLAILYGKVSAGLNALGRKAEAMEQGRRSLALFRALADAAPDDARARRELAHGYRTLGDHCWDAQDFVGALENYREGLRLHQSLAAADPANRQARRDLAYSYGDVGDGRVALAAHRATPAQRAEDWRAARRCYERSLAAYRKLRDDGQLPAREAGAIDARARDIAQCDERLKKLAGAASGK